MIRIKYLRILFSHPLFKIISSLLFIISFYDLFVSQFVIEELQPKYPRISEILSRLGLPWYGWVVIFLVYLSIVVFESSYRYIKRYETPTVLKELSELRKEGRILSGDLGGLDYRSSTDTVNEWASKHFNWREQIVQVLNKVDESLADEIRPSGRMKFEDLNPVVLRKNVLPLLIFEQTTSTKKLDGIIKEIRNKNYNS